MKSSPESRIISSTASAASLEPNALRPQPNWLRLHGPSAEDLANRYKLKLSGGNQQIEMILPLFLCLSQPSHTVLLYLEDPDYLTELEVLKGNIVVLLRHSMKGKLPSGFTGTTLAMPDEESPHELFYTIIADCIERDEFQKLETFIHPTASISSQASVASNVYISEGAVIGPFVTLYPNTYIGAASRIEAGATIGSDGFEIAYIRGMRRIVPHAGGVWLSNDVTIGSGTCIDRGLWGDFTFVGSRTKIGSNIHIAHSAAIGQNCLIQSGAQLAGTVRIENEVKIGSNANINQQTIIGDGASIETASVVSGSVPANAYISGNPARISGQSCRCGQRIKSDNNKAYCSQCRINYTLKDQKWAAE